MTDLSDLKTALYRSLTTICLSPPKQFLVNHNVLTTEDTEKVYKKMLRYQLWARSLPKLEIGDEDSIDLLSGENRDVIPTGF